MQVAVLLLIASGLMAELQDVNVRLDLVIGEPGLIIVCGPAVVDITSGFVGDVLNVPILSEGISPAELFIARCALDRARIELFTEFPIELFLEALRSNLALD